MGDITQRKITEGSGKEFEFEEGGWELEKWHSS